LASLRDSQKKRGDKQSLVKKFTNSLAGAFGSN